METRELKDSELPQLLSLYTHLHTSDEPLPDQKIVDQTWSHIQSNPDFKYFGVFDNNLVSSCTLSIIPNLTRGCRPYGLIENVVTAPSHRRRGFGKQVLQYALEHAWDRKCYKVMLCTGRKDEGTYKFYESAGFDRHAKQAFQIKPKTINMRFATDAEKAKKALKNP